jgi:hypothetical protein
LRDWPCSFGPWEKGKPNLVASTQSVAARRHRAPDHFFGAAGVIHVRCVDEIDAGIDALSMMRRAVASSVSPPNIMAPRQRGDTFRELRPRYR